MFRCCRGSWKCFYSPKHQGNKFVLIILILTTMFTLFTMYSLDIFHLCSLKKINNYLTLTLYISVLLVHGNIWENTFGDNDIKILDHILLVLCMKLFVDWFISFYKSHDHNGGMIPVFQTIYDFIINIKLCWDL